MQPITLVLDQGEALHNPQCRDVVAELAVNLPAGAKLAIASREEPPVPLARLRSRGLVAELGVAGSRARRRARRAALLQRAGVELGDAEIESLIERTEGWPVGLYLGALHAERGRHRSDRRPRLLG